MTTPDEYDELFSHDPCACSPDGPIVLSEEAARRLEEVLEDPSGPTPAMIELFRRYGNQRGETMTLEDRIEAIQIIWAAVCGTHKSMIKVTLQKRCSDRDGDSDARAQVAMGESGQVVADRQTTSAERALALVAARGLQRLRSMHSQVCAGIDAATRMGVVDMPESDPE